MRTTRASALAALLIATLAGCAARAPAKPDKPAPPPLAVAAPANYVPPCAQPLATPAAAFDCDRKSILAMAGEFRVRFAFDETAALAAGYAPHDPQRSGGTELVLVIADTGEHISLQHILVLGKEHVIVKHWRQDWQFQPASVLRFRGNGRFERQTLAADDVRGAWSQTVYEVDDAPRYAGIARWSHVHGEDSWQSDRTLRPLPRREYTRRRDYQALDVVNRHTLTPSGWVHEQDNTKLVLDAHGGSKALAREHGINSYTRITDYDFGAGREYWSKTSAFWSTVRAEWDGYASAHPDFVTSPEPDGEPRIDEFFTLADRAKQGETIASTDIRAVVEAHAKDLRAAGPHGSAAP